MGRTRWLIGVFVSILALGAFCPAQEEIPGEGEMRAISPGGEVVELPLRHTNVRVEISGIVARVEVEQLFTNPYDEVIEAVYLFPLTSGAAVDDMRLQIGERVLRGVILPRPEARESYEKAKAEGHRAALLEFRQGNVFSQSVANIEPGVEIRVLIHYVVALDNDDGRYRFCFPMVVTPRYRLAGTEEELVEGEEPVEEEVAAEPPPAPASPPPESRPGDDISIVVRLASPLRIGSVASTSHQIIVDRAGEKEAEIRLAEGESIPNRDFVLDYSVDPAGLDMGMLTHKSPEGEGHFILTLMLRPDLYPVDADPKELIFVVDTSGSMTGEPLETVKRLMLEALERIGPDDTFDVITFSSDSRPLSPAPLERSAANMEQAREWIRGMEADGGTEIVQGIRRAFKLPRSDERQRIVLVMSDGFVDPEKAILRAVRKRPPGVRLFTLGIGDSPNNDLLKKMARDGDGAYLSVVTERDPAEPMNRFYRWVSTPYLTDLSIDWGSAPVEELFPRNLPDLYAGKPLVILGRYLWGVEETIRVTGRRNGTPWEREFDLLLPEEESANSSLASLWARRKIDKLESEQVDRDDPELKEKILKLALEYRLMTPYTSFLVVDQERLVQLAEKSPTILQHAGNRTVELMVAAREDVVTVVSGAMTRTMISQSFFDDLPVLGREYQSVLFLAPGIQDAEPGGVRTNSVPTGAVQVEVDGVSNVDPLTGQFQSFVNADAIDEIEILDGDPSGGYGGAVGGYGKVITSNGGNDTEFSAGLEWMPAPLGQGRGVGRKGTSHSSLRPSISVSGPFVKDHLFYAFSQDYRWSVEPRELIASPGVDIDQQAFRHVSKLTWQVAPKSKLQLSFRGDGTETDPAFATSLVPAEGAARQDQRGNDLQLRWTVPATPTFFFEVWSAYSDKSAWTRPLRDWATPTRIEILEGGLQEGPWPVSRRDEVERLTHHFEMEGYLSDWLGASHRIKGILDYSDNRLGQAIDQRDLLLSCGGDCAELRYGGRGGRRRGEVAQFSAVVGDIFEPASNLSFNVQLGFWRERLRGRGLRAVDPAGEEAAWRNWSPSCLEAEGSDVEACLASGGLSLWTVHPEDLAAAADCAEAPNPWQCRMIQQAQAAGTPLSPRRPEALSISDRGLDLFLSAAWDPWNDGKTKLAASWSAGHDSPDWGVLFAETQPFATAAPSAGEVASLPVSGAFGAWQVSRGVHAPRNRFSSLTFEREIGPEMALRLTYSRRRLRGLLDYGDLNSRPVSWEEALAELPGAASRCQRIGSGADCFGGVAVGSGGALITLPDRLVDTRRYSPFLGSVLGIENRGWGSDRALTILLDRRYYQNWQLRVSYTLARTHRSGTLTGAALRNLLWVDESVRGPADGDRRRSLKIATRFTSSRLGPYRIGASLSWISGSPYSLVEDRLVAGFPTNLGTAETPYLLSSLTPRRTYPSGGSNDRRNPAIIDLNLRIVRDFTLAKGTLSLGFEIYNLLGRTERQLLRLQRVTRTTPTGAETHDDYPVGYYRPGRRLQLVARYDL